MTPASLAAMPPIEGRRAVVLILGSMPGAKSLADQQYYAHPRNAFWSIVATLGVARREDPYADRCRALSERDIALWDVIATCHRQGSLDANIRAEQPNDLARFARRHPELRQVLFNGKKAHEVFTRFARRGDPRLALPAGIGLQALPSTSPANTRRGKLDTWLRALGPFV